ncbi:alpha/beta hydrolase [Mesoplasma coleopterae]|uniref:Alpha/beta hydrolase n=1 Tax=Mesoplasma coleopterae TaxID=324078 RepID=A0A2K8P4T5_9MOLU|nr:hypothetical protein [Mesoplasma coleopterae]ATZ20605.1 alpha/beta hydrolase [Mesoplasma coleopterae]AVN62789.1 hypothetical protein CG000_00465 [Mesoplasma coleopterae]
MKKINIFKIVFKFVKFIHGALEKPCKLFTGTSNKLKRELKSINRISKILYKKKELQFNIPLENIEETSITTKDGIKISISLCRINDGNKWVIMNHWFTGHKYWMYIWGKPYMAMGYNILTYDLRDHGKSDSVKEMTLGIAETRDLEEIIDFLNNRVKDAYIGLFGVSLGAFIINNIGNDTQLIKNKNIKWGISDVGYISLNSLLVHLLSNRMIKIAKRKKDKLIESFFNYQKYLTGIGFEEYDSLDKFQYPVFPFRYTHAITDNTTCPLDSLKFFLKRQCPQDEITIYKKGVHAFSQRGNYYSIVADNMKFVAKIEGENNQLKEAYKIMNVNKNSGFKNKKTIDIKGSEITFKK